MPDFSSYLESVRRHYEQLKSLWLKVQNIKNDRALEKSAIVFGFKMAITQWKTLQTTGP
jgi:hypothetical protein